MNELFSPTERKVLKILEWVPRDVTVKFLTKRFFQGKSRPINPRAVVTSAILRINRKCEYHKLPWFINSYGNGRAGKTVWKDKQ